MGVGAGDQDLAGLQRLAQGVERLGLELGQLVQEEHPVVGQADLARLDPDAAAGQGGHAGGVVRGAEGAGAIQRAFGDHPGHGLHHRGLEQFRRGEGRQDAWQPLGQHRLAGTRRADEQQVVTPGGGDLEGAFGVLLALDVAQVGTGRILDDIAGPWRAHHLGAAEMVDQADQRFGSQDGRALAGPGRFRPAGLRDDDAHAHGRGGHGGGQRPGHRHDGAVEAELADRRPGLQAVMGNDPQQAHDGQGDGQVVVTALLGQVGGGQVDHDPPGRQGQAQAREGGPHPLAALGNRLVAQPDQHEGDLAARELRLDLDPARFHALEGHGDDPGGHVPTP